MRKVKDYDAEMKALEEKLRALKAERVLHYGQLVLATKADQLDDETLAGLLILGVSSKKADARDGWRDKGQTFFQERGKKSRRSPSNSSESLHTAADRQTAARG